MKSLKRRDALSVAKAAMAECAADTAVNRRMRGCFDAARRLSDGDDPIDIGKYAFEPFTEKLAEIFRNAPKKPPVLRLHYDRGIDRRFIKAYAEAIGEDDPDQAAKIHEQLEAVEREVSI